jgi:hypothetical protein
MRGREVALKGQSSAELRATSSGMAASEPLLAVHMECTSVTNMIAKKKVDQVLIRRVEMTGADTERRVRPFYCGAGKLISTTIKTPMAAITAIRLAKPRAVRILLGQSSAAASRNRKTIPMR